MILRVSTNGYSTYEMACPQVQRVLEDADSENCQDDAIDYVREMFTLKSRTLNLSQVVPQVPKGHIESASELTAL